MGRHPNDLDDRWGWAKDALRGVGMDFSHQGKEATMTKKVITKKKLLKKTK